MDKSLDEIISTNKTGKRRPTGRRNTARTQLLGNPASGPATRARVAAAAASAKSGGASGQVVPTTADKIIVSNLPTDVNEAQIKELFTSTVGPTKEVTLSYDASGRSKGVAGVTFSKRGDANKAYQQYHNRLIDGKRPMKIEIVVDPSRPLPLASRVAPAPGTNGTVSKTVAAAGGRTGGPRRRRVKRGGPGERAPKSAADLDAEMEDYTAANAPATANTAASAAAVA